jgi:hypothetical protein
MFPESVTETSKFLLCFWSIICALLNPEFRAERHETIGPL